MSCCSRASGTSRPYMQRLGSHKGMTGTDPTVGETAGFHKLSPGRTSHPTARICGSLWPRGIYASAAQRATLVRGHGGRGVT
jgi:hypothetical protein